MVCDNGEFPSAHEFILPFGQGLEDSQCFEFVGEVLALGCCEFFGRVVLVLHFGPSFRLVRPLGGGMQLCTAIVLLGVDVVHTKIWM